MGWLCRKWYSLFHRSPIADAIPIPCNSDNDSLCQDRLSCEELHDLYHHCGNGVLHLRRERKLAIEALTKKRNKLSALAHLRDMDQPLSRMEKALKQPSPGKNEETEE